MDNLDMYHITLKLVELRLPTHWVYVSLEKYAYFYFVTLA